MSGSGKVVVVGLDGGTLDVAGRLLRHGELPHLGNLRRTGVEGGLTSTIPFITPTAFASFMTGVNPGRHGIFDFKRDVHNPDDAAPLVNYTHIRTKTIWELLAEHGKRSLLVSVPFTYPPLPFDGVAVSVGNMTEGRLAVYPPELTEDVLAHIGGYDEAFVRVMREPEERPTEALGDHYIRHVRYQTEKLTQVALHLMAAQPWDLLAIVFVITDRLQHYFWRFMDERHPAYEPRRATKYGGVIDDAYRLVDTSLGEILKGVPEDAHVVIMSDHGFGPLHYVFYANRWLQDRGLLHVRPASRSWRLETRPLARVLGRLGLSALAEALRTPCATSRSRCRDGRRTVGPCARSSTGPGRARTRRPGA